MSTTHLNWIVTTLALTLSSPLRAGEPYQQKQSQGFLNSLSNMVFSRSVSEQPRKIDALKAKELLEERLMENQKSRLQQRIQQDNFRASQAQQGVAFGNVSANQQLDQTFNMPQGVYQQTPNSLDMNQGLFDARTLSTAVMLPPTPPDRPDHPPLLKIFVPDDGITIPRPSDMILIDEDQVRRLTPEKTPEPEVTQTQPDAQPLREGRVRAHIGDGPRVEIRASYRVNIPEEGYRWLELQLDGVVVRKATIGDQDLRVVPDGRALVKGPINDTLELEIDTLGERDDDQGRFTLRLPPCPTTRVELDLPGVELETNADGLLDLTSTSATGRTLISAWASKRNIQVTYYKATPEPITRIDDATPGVAHTPAEPEARITAKLHTQYEYADGVLTGTTFGNFSITKPGVSQISLSLPVGMELISITDGENKRLDTFAFDAGEKNSNLTLFLPARRTRPLDLTIIQKRIVGGVATRIIELHPAAMSDATKVTLTGSFVGPAQGAHFEPAFSESDGLIEDIDITKVDPIFVHKLSQSPIAAWRVLKPERTDWGSLEIHRNRLRKASIQKFEILEAQADSIMTGDAVALTRILLKINNTREQFLAIQLPAGSSIQSVFVRNRPVKPGLQAASEIVIPLVKSKILGTGPETFLVEIIYRHSTSAYATAGTVNVELLKIKGKIAVFDWRIYFPEGLELKERQTTPGLVFDGRNGSTTQTFVMPASRMNEITNNYDARTQNAAIQAPVREHSGMLPVRVPFPEDYRGFKYTKRLVPEDAAPLSVTYYYVKRSNLMFLTNILLALSFMFAAGIIYAATRRTSILGPGSGVLICLGLLASIESLFGLRLSYLGGVQMALLLGLAHLLLYPFRRWLTPLIVILPLLLFTHAQAAEESPKALYIVNDKRIIHAAKEDSAGFGLIDAKLVEELESKLKQELLTHKKEEPVAPVPFIILEGRVTGNLENSVARLHFEYEVDILQEGWQRLPLITGDLTVSDVTVDAGTPGQVIVHETEQLIREEVSQNTVILNSLTTENEQLQNLSKSISFDLMIRGVGRHSVRFDAESSIARVSEEHYRLSISPPPFSRSAMELKLNAKDLNVRLDGRPVSNLEENTADGSTKLRVPLPMTRPIVVDWRERAIAALPVSIPSVVAFPSPTGRPGSDDQEDILADTSSAPSPPPPPTPQPATPESLDPVIVCDSVTKVTLDDTSVEVRSFFNLQIHRSGVNQLNFVGPEGLKTYTVLESPPPGGMNRVHRFEEVTEGGQTRIRVLLKSKVKDSLIIVLTYTLKVPDSDDRQRSLAVPNLICSEATFQSGVIGVEREGSVEVNEGPRTGLDPVRPDRLEAETLRLMDGQIQYAYRHASKEWSLELELQKHADVDDMASAVIFKLAATTRLQLGVSHTRIDYNIRNNGNPYLKLRLPEGDRLLKVSVAGRDVTPDIDEEDRYLVSLGSSSGQTQSTVSIEYESSPGDPIRLALPRTDLSVTGEGVLWIVHAPDGKVLTDLPDSITRQPPRRWRSPLRLEPAFDRATIRYHAPFLLGGDKMEFTVSTGSKSMLSFTNFIGATLGFFLSLFLVIGLAWIHRPTKGLPRLLVAAAFGGLAFMLERMQPGSAVGTSQGCLAGLFVAFVAPVIRWLNSLRSTAALAIVFVALCSSQGPLKAQDGGAATSLSPITQPVSVTQPASITQPVPVSQPASITQPVPVAQPISEAPRTIEGATDLKTVESAGASIIGREYYVEDDALDSYHLDSKNWIVKPKPEIRRLFRALNASPATPIPAAEDVPQVQIPILRGRITGRVLGDSARLEAIYSIHVHKKGVLRLGFDPTEVSIRGLEVDGSPATMLMKSDGTLPDAVLILLDRTGPMEIKVDLTAPVDIVRHVSLLQFQFPPCPHTELELEIPTEKPIVSVVPSTRVDLEPLTSGNKIRTLLKFGRTLFVRWQDPVGAEPETGPDDGIPTEETKAAVEPEEEAVFDVIGSHRSTVSSGRVESHIDMTVQMRAGALSTCLIKHPKDFVVTNVDDSEKATFRPSPDGAETLVQFRSKRRATFTMRLSGFSPTTSTNDEDTGARHVLASIPRVEVAGSQSQKGTIKLLLPEGEDIREERIEGLARNDDTAGNLRNRSGVDRIYQYLQRDYELLLRLIRHPTADVQSTRISRCEVQIYLPESGFRMGHATYQVSNDSRQFLAIKLPEGSLPLSCFVDGKPQRPGKGEAGILVPLSKSPTQGNELVPFPVEIAYLVPPREGSESLGWTGWVEPPIPEAELPIDQLELIIHMPKTFALSGHEGPILSTTPSLTGVLSKTLSLDNMVNPLQIAMLPLYLVGASRTASFQALSKVSDPLSESAQFDRGWAPAPMQQGFRNGAKRQEMDARRGKDESRAMPAKEMNFKNKAPMALSPQMPGAPRRRDLVGGEGGRNANLESKEKLAIDGQLAYADGLAGGVPYGMYEQERSNDEDFALGENESALAPSPSSPPQEMQPQVSSQFLTKLKSANRGRRGALPVKISFNPPSDRYQATRFAVVLHDRNVPIRLRYTDLRWVAPVLALLFLIFPVCLIGYALGPDSSRFRKLSSLFLLMMSGLAAYSFELSGLETFSWFCASIPIGVLALPILALIRR